jgi:DNA-binding LytR/AlgR family response regulator
MKLVTIKNNQIEDLKVTIEAREDDPELAKVLHALEILQVDFVGKKEGKSFLFAPKDVYYIESTEDQCLLYTKSDVYDCKYRLYEVEEMNPSFLRVNKQIVLNIDKIKSFRSTLNGKIEATLINQDRIEISRSYVQILKSRLGGQS